MRSTQGLALTVLLVLAGCGMSKSAAIPPPSLEMAGAQPAADAAKPGSASAPLPATRMIIRKAEITLIVTDAEIAMRSVGEIVAAQEGYLSDSRTWRQNEQVRASLTIRVPAGNLDATMNALKALAIRVDSENVTGEDVTEEFSDLSAQLKNLEATEIELRELLTTVRERAQKAADILQVYQELVKIRGEIERVKGRMQYLSTLTELATLKVDLIPDALARPVVEPGWRPLRVVRSASRALVNTLKLFAEIAIWVVLYVIPVVLVVVVGIWILVAILRLLIRRKRKAPPLAATQDRGTSPSR